MASAMRQVDSTAEEARSSRSDVVSASERRSQRRVTQTIDGMERSATATDAPRSA